ncbi:GtrA family protein [Paenibacillus sp. FSL M8-0334]|uniref:GtrA family protein n=1 Tax=Paenibacillus sp. FSL M8-0334 TaxID=2921623 RepID=UPI0040470347
MTKILTNILNNQFVKYALVGVIGTIIHTLILIVLTEFFFLKPILSTSFGFIASLLLSYYLNSKWTFSSNKMTTVSFVKYFTVSLSGLFLNIAILYIFVDLFNLWYIWAQVVIVVIVPIYNYLLNKLWSFNNSREYGDIK